MNLQNTWYLFNYCWRTPYYSWLLNYFFIMLTLMNSIFNIFLRLISSLLLRICCWHCLQWDSAWCMFIYLHGIQCTMLRIPAVWHSFQWYSACSVTNVYILQWYPVCWYEFNSASWQLFTWFSLLCYKYLWLTFCKWYSVWCKLFDFKYEWCYYTGWRASNLSPSLCFG